MTRIPSITPAVANWAPWPSALHDARHSGASTAAGPRGGVARWRRALEGAVTPGPVVGADGTVYASSNGGVLHALDPATGADRWTYASVVTDGTGRVYTTVDSALVAVDDKSNRGVIAWRVDPDDQITEVSPGLAADGTVLLGTNGNSEWAYRRDGSLAWQAPRFITYSSPSVTADGLAYLGDHAGRVLVFDVGTGEKLGECGPAGGLIWTSIVVDGGTAGRAALRRRRRRSGRQLSRAHR